VKAVGGVYGYVMPGGLFPVPIDLVYQRASQIESSAFASQAAFER
jgi:hypothetical protein